MAMQEDEVQKIVKMTVNEVVPHVVEKTLTRYGIDADNPIEVQKDQQHLRTWRTRMDSAGGRVWMAAIVVVVGFGSQMFGAGLVDYIRALLS